MNQGDIYLVDFGTNSVGHEYQKNRPALVIESDEQLKQTSLVTVVPLTSKIKNKFAEDILVKVDAGNCLFGDSLLKMSCITSFDKTRFFHPIGAINADVLQKVKVYIKI
jgi:mRNA interferase MazF